MTAARWPQNYASSHRRAARTFVDCSNAANITDFGSFAGGTPTKETDPSVTLNGAATTKIVVPQGVTRLDFGIASGFVPPLGWDGTLLMAVRVDEASRIDVAGASMVMYLGDLGFANIYTGTYGGSAPSNYGYMNPGQWNYIKFMPERYAVSAGSPTFAGTARCKVRFNLDAGSAACNIWIGGFFLPVAARAKVALVLDDAYDEHYSFAAVEAATYNVPINIAVPSDLVDTANFMTTAQCRELAAQPELYALLNHSNDNTFYTVAGLSGMLDRFNACRDWLRENGCDFNSSASHTVYPGGFYDASLSAALRDDGFLTGRGASSSVLIPYLPTYAENDPQMFGLPLVDYLSNARTITQVKASIDRIINYGGLGVIMAHNFDVSAGAAQWANADFTALLQYIALKRSQGLIDAVTIPQWHAGLTQPALVAA